MRGPLLVIPAVALSMAVSAGPRLSSQTACAGCVAAGYWEVDPQYFEGPPNMPAAELPRHFPELHPDYGVARRDDVGVAFSGGGTRSASATLGQLRGLRANGWLERIRYITAVSGGSWAAVPFTYYDGNLDDLLGTTLLTPAALQQQPAGYLAARIVDSGLAHTGLQELPQLLPDEIAGRDLREIRRVLSLARGAIRRFRGRNLPEPDRRNKTYARMLGRIFIDGLVDRGNRQPYTWTASAGASVTETSGEELASFTTVPGGRPFLIVGGTVVRPFHPGAYPQLIPVEYTPLYTGVRQRLGPLGGTYVTPWAYDRLIAAPRSATEVLVSPGPLERPFTLADMIASSGAAPQLTAMIGAGASGRFRDAFARAAEAFPAFTNLAVRGGAPLATGTELAHGDGGFTDNLGLMPLLARQVRNIIVFVNTNQDWTRNNQLQSYFMRLSRRDGSGDKSINAVFDRARYVALVEGLDAAAKTGTGPAVFCASGWSVGANQLYNIRPYDGLNICWIYNYAATDWRRNVIPDEVEAWLEETRAPGSRPKTDPGEELQHFPYYATFGENRPYVIRLTTLQVNLLAALGEWSITNDATVREIRRVFPRDVLQANRP